MKKQEFLDGLEAALGGRVRPAVVMDNISYYEDYINTEIRKGKTEEEVMEALGDPRMIARTIADTNVSNAAESRGVYADEEQDYSGGFYGRQGFPRPKLPGWVWLILAAVAAVLVIGALFSVLSVILPVLLPILFFLFLAKAIRDWFY